MSEPYPQWDDIDDKQAKQLSKLVGVRDYVANSEAESKRLDRLEWRGFVDRRVEYSSRPIHSLYNISVAGENKLKRYQENHS